jgi:acetyl esterase/lipase
MKRSGCVLLLIAGFVLSGALVRAQRPSGDAASFAAYTGYRAVPNITYTTASGVELKLDFYGPARPSGPVPTAIFMHGGGYRIGSRKEASVFSVLPYVQMGWNAVNVEYRASGIALAPARSRMRAARCAG